MSINRKAKRDFFAKAAAVNPNGNGQQTTGSQAPQQGSPVPMVNVWVDPSKATPLNPNGVMQEGNMAASVAIQILGEAIRNMGYIVAGQLIAMSKGMQPEEPGPQRPVVSRTGLVNTDGSPAIIDPPEAAQSPIMTPSAARAQQMQSVMPGDGGEQPPPVMAPAHPEPEKPDE
jgi:hypothetical protein